MLVKETVPEGMLRSAATLELYPNCLMKVEEYVVITPLEIELWNWSENQSFETVWYIELARIVMSVTSHI
jgi:hypothetical protein